MTTQDNTALVPSDDDLLKQAKLILDEYVQVAQKLVSRGVTIGIGIDNGSTGNPVKITSMQAVRVLVNDPPAPTNNRGGPGGQP